MMDPVRLWNEELRPVGSPRYERLSIVDRRLAIGGQDAHPTIRAELGVAEDELKRRIGKYLSRLAPSMRDANGQAVAAVTEYLTNNSFWRYAGEDEFARAVWNIVERLVGDRMGEPDVRAAVDGITNDTYRYYRLRDAAVWGSVRPPIIFSINPRDERAMRAVSGVDQFYLGKFIETDQAREAGLKFLREQYLERGAPMFGRTDPEVLNQFRQALGKRMGDLTQRQLQTIADTSVVRMRSYGHLNQMWEAGITRARWVKISDYVCAVCDPFDGKEWDITNSVARFDAEIQMAPEEWEEYLKAAPKGPRADPLRSLKFDGEMPPLHPNCLCRIVSVV